METPLLKCLSDSNEKITLVSDKDTKITKTTSQGQ